MKTVVLIFVLAIALFNLNHVLGNLRCYTCSLPTIAEDEENPDLTCLNAPANVSNKPSVICSSRMKYCMIYRNDYKESGKIASLLRTCEEKPPLMNDDIEGPVYIAHYRACTKDLCNGGNGISSADGSVDGNGNGGIGGIIVPDRSAGIPINKINTFLLCGILLRYFDCFINI